MAIELELPPPPTYEISEEFICHKCSKPRIFVRTDYGWHYREFDCPINQKAPLLHDCPHFSREPGVD